MDDRGRNVRPVVMGEKRDLHAEARAAESPLLKLFRREGGSRLARALAFFWIPLGLVSLLAYAVLTDDRAAAFLGGKVGTMVEQVVSRPEFALEELRVTGRREVSEAAVREAIGLEAGASSLGFDPALARARLEENPWIAAAQVSIEPPGSVVVSITERVPGAVWQADGAFRIIDRLGDPIVDIDGPAERPDLPYLVGEGANLAISEALSMLASAPAPLVSRIGALTRVGERRWDVEMIGGMRLLLPEDEPAAALRRFASIDARDTVLDRQITLFDMRLPDHAPLARVDDDAAASRIRLLEERLSGAARNP